MITQTEIEAIHKQMGPAFADLPTRHPWKAAIRHLTDLLEEQTTLASCSPELTGEQRAFNDGRISGIRDFRAGFDQLSASGQESEDPTHDK